MIPDDFDLELFVENAAWCVARLRNPSIEGLLTWCAAWMEPEGLVAWRHLVELDLPARVQGEQSLIRALKDISTDLPRRAESEWFVSETVERSTDWARTWCLAEGSPFLRLHGKRTRRPVDRQVVEALVGLADSWARTLLTWGHSAGHAGRRASLEVEVSNYGRAGLRPGPWTCRVDSLKARVGPNALATVTRARRVLGLLRDPAETAAALTEAGRALKLSPKNQNDLFELSFRLAIARAATSSASYGGWLFQRPLECANQDKRVALRRGQLACALYKGRPTGCTDRLAPLGSYLGLRPTGNQPDLVVEFRHDAVPGRRVVVLGDAKRNAAGDGRSYLADSLEVATVYGVSYSHVMELQLNTAMSPGLALFAGPVTPAVTLFMLQSPMTTGHQDERRARIVEDLSSTAPMPFCLAIDAITCFPPGTDLPSDVLGAWFNRLAAAAERHLLTL